MPRRRIEATEVDHFSILDERGQVDESAAPIPSPSQLRWMFEQMVRMREFDQRAISMQRQGRLGTYAPALGQEAIHIATAAALEATDWVVPSFREQGVLLSRGVKPATLFLFFMGSEEGNRLPRKLRTLPDCVPCASQILHAVGIAMAAKFKKDPVAVAAYFGDGATSEGDFHEGLNFAGVYQTPNLFLCQNNQWAISTPREAQTRSRTLAQKALSYGFPGLQVDGNDVLGVYAATQEAVQRARSGGGPTLLECLTYRMGVHTTSDDPNRYRDHVQVETWKQRDPIDRFETYLLAKNILAPGERQQMIVKIGEELKAAAAEAEELCRHLSPDEMFLHTYSQIPDCLKSQREAVLRQMSALDSEGSSHG